MARRKTTKSVNGGVPKRKGTKKPTARRRVDRRTRRTSRSITLPVVTQIDRAWRHAQTLGLCCNVLLTLKPRYIDALTPLERQASWKKYRDRIAQFAKRHSFTLAYIWARESVRDTGTGEHLHVLIHIPLELQGCFERMIKRWAKHPDEVHIRSAGYKTWWTKRRRKRCARAYLTKNSHQASRYLNETWKPGGPILGKRVGCTMNLGGRARAEFRAARRTPPASPPPADPPF